VARYTELLEALGERAAGAEYRGSTVAAGRRVPSCAQHCIAQHCTALLSSTAYRL
jgi:hypothetical protein